MRRERHGHALNGSEVVHLDQEDAPSTSQGIVDAMDGLRETVKLGVEQIRYRSKATGTRAIQFFHVPKGEDHPTICHDDGAPFSRLHSETLIPRLRSETLIPESSSRGLHSRAFVAILGIPYRALPCALLDSLCRKYEEEASRRESSAFFTVPSVRPC